MKIELKVLRFIFTEESTISEFYLNGTLFGYTLEDKDRDYNKDGDLLDENEKKQYGITAIPSGTYKAIIYQSPKHGRCILLKDVPGFDMVEIHAGNWAKDSLGCLLIGSSYTTNMVKNSKETLKRLLEQIKNTDEITVIISYKNGTGS